MSSTPENAERPGAVPDRAPDRAPDLQGADENVPRRDAGDVQDVDEYGDSGIRDRAGDRIGDQEVVGEDQGEYIDSDLEEQVEPVEVGSYTDSDLEAHPGPTDVGTYTDDNVTTEHRPEPAEGSYTDIDLEDDDSEERPGNP